MYPSGPVNVWDDGVVALAVDLVDDSASAIRVTIKAEYAKLQ